MLPVYEFHISQQARDYYQFDQGLFSLSGNVIFANFRAVREFVHKMNAKRDLVRFPEQAVRAGEINAMGLIDEILHYVIAQYRQQINPQAIQAALIWLENTVCGDGTAKGAGCDSLDHALMQFVAYFPPLSVYRQEISAQDYLEGETGGVSNREIVLEEMLMLWLANVNPAFSPYLELFDDEHLERETVYGDKKPKQIISGVYAFFKNQPPFGPEHQNLIDMLRAPALASPHSLIGQLEYILNKWADIIGDRFLYRLLGGLDLVKEETRIIFGVGDGGVTPVYEFTGMEKEPERFSPDRDWMPSLVMIAKHTYVWLDQLSKKYQRPIQRLDQIPDEELDTLSRMGFTGLWFIGVWERSSASQKIKQWSGNPEAMASAYSLYDYQVASDLGGDDAFYQLKERAWKRGIRLGADMVPNHTGIYSKWIVEHPDWYVSLPFSPFPSYSFNTGNLSEDGGVGVYLEEHYFTRTDAAVVFKRVDHWSGSETYIYHGNDGTSMPWNDTAQLNYLNPEVREAVIQTVLHVARRFPIIRFDAAMTLTKLHYQRLWFPEPGSGGAIPSRAEFGLTKAKFNEAMPEEFWRQVVDRVAQEAPDTLLLAEAFWLLEGFFVRTLGMHRVYNSAFMNMLRDEKNDEYRQVIKNTIEFDPEILKRYVNFMNNPDERTAVDQFGRGDKYFGICLMMSTMPGLPMFGHGQIEGFAEKYGMEYRRAYWEEEADTYMIERHEKEIAPLLHRRYLFAEVKDFLLYDLYTPAGNVDENVFAYSNRSGSERALIVYHNKFADTRGWIRMSAAYVIKSGGDERYLMQKSLAEGLGLHNDANIYAIFRDHKTGLEFIRNSRQLFEQGLYVELNAYQYNVFLDFREVVDNEWHQYAHLEAYLNGRGVPSVDEAVKELFLQPVHQPFKEIVNAGQFEWLLQHRMEKDTLEEREALQPILDEFSQKMFHLLYEIGTFSQLPVSSEEISRTVQECRLAAEVILSLPVLAGQLSAINIDKMPPIGEALFSATSLTQSTYGTLLVWLATHCLAKPFGDGFTHALQARTWVDEWLLNKMAVRSLVDMGLQEASAWQIVGVSNLLITHQDWYKSAQDGNGAIGAYSVLRELLEDPEVQRFLRINRFKGILWFNQEAFDRLLWWMLLVAVVQILSGMQRGKEQEAAQQISDCYQLISQLQQAEQVSEYQVEKLIEAVKV